MLRFAHLWMWCHVFLLFGIYFMFGYAYSSVSDQWSAAPDGNTFTPEGSALSCDLRVIESQDSAFLRVYFFQSPIFGKGKCHRDRMEIQMVCDQYRTLCSYNGILQVQKNSYTHRVSVLVGNMWVLPESVHFPIEAGKLIGKVAHYVAFTRPSASHSNLEEAFQAISK